jgi:uncharacterized membrane protein YfcA
MDINTLILFLLLTLVAEIFGTVGGFGSSVFFVPIAGFFVDFHSVLGITVMLHMLSNVSKIALFRKSVDRRLLLQIGLPSLIFVIIGGWLTSKFDTSVLKLLLALFLITMSLFFLVIKNAEVRPTASNAIVGGGISGLIAGLVGTGGAVRGLTMAAYNLEKEVFVATSSMIDFFTDAGRTFVYAGQGYIHDHDLYLIPFLLLAALLGTWIGKLLLQRIDQTKFRKLVLSFILVIGVVSLLQYFMSNPLIQLNQ